MVRVTVLGVAGTEVSSSAPQPSAVMDEMVPRNAVAVTTSGSPLPTGSGTAVTVAYGGGSTSFTVTRLMS